jgi:hypothetical protein
MNEYLGGLRFKVEAEKIRDLLIKRYRLWIPGGLEMVSKSLTVEPTPEMNRTKTDSYPASGDYGEGRNRKITAAISYDAANAS